MEALLHDLLEYARASSDHPEHIQAISLEPALDYALNNLRAGIEETKAIITHAELPTLQMAPVHAQLLFQNLIGNALKYRSAEVPRIHINARQDRKEWTISVRDNGIGIAREHADRIFGMFKRLHSAAQYSGTGMGLAICKKIVERYGGRIGVESQPGKGSTFSFSIPQPRV
jgi:light-regulated signal transduction histidine kinase (bacteriophytochrome)